METQNTQAPVSTTPTAMSTARKALLAGLGLAFFSLFLHYTTATVNIQLWSPPTSMYSVWAPASNTAIGFQYKPWAVWAILALAAVYCTAIGASPFWRRYGYWLAFVLLFCLSPWQDNLIPFIAWIIVGVAAFLNGRELKARPDLSTLARPRAELRRPGGRPNSNESACSQSRRFADGKSRLFCAGRVRIVARELARVCCALSEAVLKNGPSEKRTHFSPNDEPVR